MSMKKHRCQICSKLFSNGRALGGHMRSHLVALPLPPRFESDLSSTRSEHEQEEKLLWEGGSEVVQVRESKAESTQNPTRKRTMRVSHLGTHHLGRVDPKKSKRVRSESAQLSSGSDPSSQDEEVALCLMMLSRDVWDVSVAELNMPCWTCSTRTTKKVLSTGRALVRHKATNKKCCQENSLGVYVGRKYFECPFCHKVFGSGQALGGHKRSHLLGSSPINNVVNFVSSHANDAFSNGSAVDDTSSFIFDLNLPPPVHDDDDYRGMCIKDDY